MNRKGMSSGLKFVVTAALLLFLLVLGLALAGKGFKFTSKMTTCPEERCITSTQTCATGLQKAIVLTCKDEERVCCLSPKEIINPSSVDTNIQGARDSGSSGSGTGTGNGNSGNGPIVSTGTGTSVIKIIYTGDETTEVSSGTAISAVPGQVIKLTMWVDKGQDICSINLRNVTSSTNRMLLTNPAPSWFIGEVTRQNCNSTNKKDITITVPTEVAEQKFKLDVMTFKDTDMSSKILASKTIFINVGSAGQNSGNSATNGDESCPDPSSIPVADQLPSCMAGASIVLNNQNLDLTNQQTVYRTSGFEPDTFNIKTIISDRNKCTVKLYDMTSGGAGTEFYPSSCVSGFVNSPVDCTSSKTFTVYYYNSTIDCTANFLKKEMQVRVSVYNDANAIVDTESVNIVLY